MSASDHACSQLEREALENGHDIGEGFYDAQMLRARMLRMDCSRCSFFAVVCPATGRHLKSAEGRCNGQHHQDTRI